MPEASSVPPPLLLRPKGALACFLVRHSDQGDSRQGESDAGHALYKQRQAMIEPVFAHTKHNRRADHFKRRGRAACRSEWRLITATHNLLKLHRHQTALATA
jgi:hypothetical protein